ncbi:MAG: DUF4011 domain-containing protein [Methanomassiliicoccaceae archaeon]|jgi:hypothetical protein|nr:DUF4011 domain-containing protein [Methanomassiliicoccaceae archaeon]
MAKNVVEDIEKLRSQLLEMGKTNNLVNYQMKDERSIQITEAGMDDILTKLVIDGGGLRVTNAKMAAAGSDDLRSLSSRSDIDGKLERLIQRYKEDFDDLGYTTVFVALGFIVWKGKGGARAPVVLLPAKLKRDDTGNVRIFWSGDDVCVSPTLIEKLKESNVRVPPLDPIETVGDLKRCMDSVKASVEGRAEFGMNENILIDVFDFSKSVMYNDLDTSSWSKISPLVDKILNPPTGIIEKKEDRPIPSCTYSILNADASQMYVIMDVLDGQSVVVEGPPGTGKSQTIANIIAECLGNGRTVLFVSEKMAALNIVKKRLDDAGLRRYVLELHSENSNRKNFLKEMERSMSSDMITEPLSEQECAKLERTRGELDAYASAISSPIGKRELTPYQLIGMRESAHANIRRRKRNPVRVEIASPGEIDDSGWDSMISLLRSAADIMPRVMPVKKNIWKEHKVCNFTPDREHSLIDNINNVNKRLDDISGSSKDICKLIGVAVPQTLNEMSELNDTCENMRRYGGMALKEIMEGDPDEYIWATEPMISAVASLQRLRNNILTKYKETVLDIDADELAARYAKYENKLLGGSKLRDIKKTMDFHALSGPVAEADVGGDLDKIAKYRKELKEFAKFDPKNLFGNKWRGPHSDAVELKGIRDWTVTVKKNIKNNKFTDTTALLISRGTSGTPLDAKMTELNVYVNDMMRSVNMIDSILGMQPKDDRRDMKPMAMRKWLKDLSSNIESLRPWGNYCDLLNKFDATPISGMAPRMSAGDIHPQDLVDTFTLNFSGALLAEAVNQRAPLRSFSFETHDMLIKDHDILDRTVLETNKIKLASRLISITSEKMMAEDEKIKILKGEFNRGHGQMSVRKIMNLAGNAVKAIKPCFMMSPRSVAQFIDRGALRFDVVIFDEASQVQPAESVGSLMRADQAVIMGDSKQLPPTAFFEKKGESTDGVAMVTDMESLLNLCRASLPVRVLAWHYRSRHDSLMALSNRLFYDDRLMVCPSPCPPPEDMGLRLRYVRSAVYERGITGSNPKEAKMIARAVWHHYVDTPDRSLGIVTFNINQQKAIMSEVEKMFKRHPDARANMMKHTDEPFMIRNLESVQGDERDVMFVSIGYGYDTDGKLSKSFGSLNREGGERRLNVLMTRSREQCVLFSNFKAADMGMREGMPEGVKALQAYLEYAEFGYTSKLDTPPLKDQLAESVATFLASKGVRTRMNVGTSSFRIDLAVCSPKDPNTFILAICLDGRTYQRIKYTRDRDRMFSYMLSRMGWDMCRVWSMDWYSNPDNAKKRLWNKVSAVLSKVSAEVKTDSALFNTISEMIELEAPVCRDVIYNRIKKSSNAPKISAALKKDVEEVIASCIYLGKTTEDDGFLMAPNQIVMVRKRDPAEKWKPEWVHHSEYTKALREASFGGAADADLITVALAKLGLPNTAEFRDEIEQYTGPD